MDPFYETAGLFAKFASSEGATRTAGFFLELLD